MNAHWHRGRFQTRQTAPFYNANDQSWLIGRSEAGRAEPLTDLFAQEVQLITKLRQDIKNRLFPLMDKLLLRKRSLIETVNDQLKNISQIEHSRHRSVANF